MQPPQPPQPPRQINLEIPANLSPVYANFVVINHTHSEVILDFAQLMLPDPRARVLARIVMTPANAKSFLNALGINLEHFEREHGEIKLPLQSPTLADQLFGGFKPEDDKDKPPNE
jgi:hypothetical protein